nr:hypothetical protein [Tanacetum cinerariifolium]
VFHVVGAVPVVEDARGQRMAVLAVRGQPVQPCGGTGALCPLRTAEPAGTGGLPGADRAVCLARRADLQPAACGGAQTGLNDEITTLVLVFL